jgi:hypothetical protein
MFDIYLLGLFASYCLVAYSGHFHGYAHNAEMRGLSLNHVTALVTLCIMLWPGALLIGLIITITERIEGNKK